MNLPFSATLTPSLMALAGTMLAVSPQSAHAAIVQINLNSTLTLTTNTLVEDVTGDGNSDIVLGTPDQQDINDTFKWVQVTVNLGLLKSIYAGDTEGHASFSTVGSGTQPDAYGMNWDTSVRARYLNQITVTDPRINGGAATQGYLDVIAEGAMLSGGPSITFGRFVYDNANTTLAPESVDVDSNYATATFGAVPEPSSLGLIGLGACLAGLRRRRD